MKKYRKPIAYSLLVISCLAWAVLPVIPFLPYENEQLLGWGTGVFVFAEITWWLAIPLLGKEAIAWCQQAWGKTRVYLADLFRRS